MASMGAAPDSGSSVCFGQVEEVETGAETMTDTTRILRDMCHAIGLSVYQPHSKSFAAYRYRNGYSESYCGPGLRSNLAAAVDAGMVKVSDGAGRGPHEYTRWSVTPAGIEWCWRYVLAAKPDREVVAVEFMEVL